MSRPITNGDNDFAWVRLRPGLAVVPMQQGVQLRGGDEEVFVVETADVQMVQQFVTALATGTTRQELLRQAGDSHSGLVGELLDQLSGQGLLTNGDVRDENEIDRYLSHFVGGLSGASAGAPLRSAPATQAVFVAGHLACTKLLSVLLAEHGIAAEAAADASLADAAAAQALTCIWEQPDLSLARRVNELACQSKKACLFVDLSHGQHATVGPFYVPGEGACYECFRQRLRENTAAVAEFDATERAMLNRGPLVGYGMLPAFRYQAVGVACLELFAFLTRHRPLRTLNRAATLDFEHLKMWTEPVWRVPWCSACGRKRP